MSTIIIGMGNPVLSDDSVGIKVAHMLAHELRARPDVETRELWAGGLRLMEALKGHERAIIIDAVVTQGGKPGSVYTLNPSDLRQSRNTCSAHDAGFQEALELGAMLGLNLPQQITIWAVEADDVETFSENLTRDVKRAVPKVVEGVMRQIDLKKRIPASGGEQP
ncbi:MAG: hydrogenase maturation protease [Terriglobia bacterium]|jgi:hydrogenase maturation protease